MAYISVSGTGFAAPTRGWAVSRLAPLLLTAAAFALPGASPSSSLEVDIDALRSTKGLVRICLTRDPANFPGCVDDAQAITRSIPARDPETVFTGLSPGDYAIAVIHDANGNAKLDTFAGVPREGIGFSRNPKFTFGPPRFAAARFTMAHDAQRQQVRMRYFL